MITLMYSNFTPSAAHVERLAALAGAARVVVAADEAGALAIAAQTQIVLGHRYLRQLLPHAPALRWVQSSAAGYDQLPWAELAARGIALSRNPMNSQGARRFSSSSRFAISDRIIEPASAGTGTAEISSGSQSTTRQMGTEPSSLSVFSTR